MSSRTLLLFLVAIMIALAAVVIVKNRMQGGSEGVKVLVATMNIDTGNFVRADKQLGWADWQGEISPSFITSQNFRIEDFNGAVARRQIMSGEPVTLISVVRVNEGGFMSAVLLPGKRAVSIAVSPTSGNAGFVFPGDHVDLILTHRIPMKDGATDVLASETFIEDARVLAVDQMLTNPDNVAVVAKTLTLEVNPKQAEKINVATNLGSISVSLRSLVSSPEATTAAQGEKTTHENAAEATTHGAPTTENEVKAQTHPAPLVAGGRLEVVESTKSANNDAGFSTDHDVSKLIIGKSAVRSKVNVFRGSTSEQVDFQQGK